MKCDNCECETDYVVDYFALLCPTCKSLDLDLNQLMNIGINAQERKVEIMKNRTIIQTTIKQWR